MLRAASDVMDCPNLSSCLDYQNVFCRGLRGSLCSEGTSNSLNSLHHFLSSFESIKLVNFMGKLALLNMEGNFVLSLGRLCSSYPVGFAWWRYRESSLMEASKVKV